MNDQFSQIRAAVENERDANFLAIELRSRDRHQQGIERRRKQGFLWAGITTPITRSPHAAQRTAHRATTRRAGNHHPHNVKAASVAERR